ncbi:hypothetical protein [Leptospira noguchii]|uniref:hypothetical protein n=1 Tax=Leptospira noguchii TaxID=28182 RepID=UPI001FB647F1|nr:hypothetical protein [Leptospira noguchii]UOG31038.1 hypothetical protein MAL06_02940 [Leptospira noguchii]UOG49260.1 hypothetical protein MAL00_02855 [Leptospira noguchii]UOG53190.1 hypothetical protein MAL09_03070 [Leptospira noguchii]
MNELKQNALLNSASHSPNSAKHSLWVRVLGSKTHIFQVFRQECVFLLAKSMFF